MSRLSKPAERHLASARLTMPLPPSIRRLLTRPLGRGPWRVGSFADVLAKKSATATRALAAPEQFDGVVACVAPEGFYYPTFTAPLGPNYRPGGLAPLPARELWLLSPGAVAGSSGLVYEPRSRTAVRETALDWHLPPSRHPLLSAPGFPAAQTLPGLSLSLVTLSAEGFWHFLMESLPRLALAAPWFAQIDHFLVNGPATPWKQRWLIHAGISSTRIVWVEALSHFACDQLLFTPPLVADCQPTPWSIAALRTVLHAPPNVAPPSRRIWASRHDATSRQPTWEREILAALPGWESVEFSHLTPSEVIALCRDTAVLAGPHGANLANAAFLPRGSTLIEIMPDGPAKPLFHRLAVAAGLEFSNAVADFNSSSAAAHVVACLDPFSS